VQRRADAGRFPCRRAVLRGIAAWRYGRPVERPPAIRLAARAASTEAEGPFARFALWVQGCPLRCDGCCNPKFLDPRGGEIVSVDALARDILATPGIEGVTLLGGEPFAQAAPLALLAARLRGAGLGVIAFSGYTLDELRASPDRGVAALLAETDLLIDGRYDRALGSGERRFIGSDNQRVHALGRRYAALVAPGAWPRGGDVLEVRLDGARAFVNGTPDPDVARLLAALR
jgi:anaerobic ribonucleoside-triphosphate reductase activating protein